jgi:hypothetical protein
MKRFNAFDRSFLIRVARKRRGFLVTPRLQRNFLSKPIAKKTGNQNLVAHDQDIRGQGVKGFLPSERTA